MQSLFLSRGFRAKLKVVGLWVLFWFHTPPPPLQSANPRRGLCQDVLGPLVGTPEKQNFAFDAAETVVSGPARTPLPANVARPSDAGSCTLAVGGAARCPAAAACRASPTQCSETPERGVSREVASAH